MRRVLCFCACLMLIPTHVFSQDDVSPVSDAPAAVSAPASVSSSFVSSSTLSVAAPAAPDLSRYSFLSEYSAEESAGGGIVARSIKDERLQIGLSFGWFTLSDGSGGSAGNQYLSAEDANKSYVGVGVTGKLGPLSAMAGVHMTYNAHYMPLMVSVGYDFEINSYAEDMRSTYYMRDAESISNLGKSLAARETFTITAGLSSANFIPLSSKYSFTTSLMADLSGSVVIPEASYLTLNLRLSVGWGHLFNSLLDVNDFFALSVMLGANLNVL